DAEGSSPRPIAGRAAALPSGRRGAYATAGWAGISERLMDDARLETWIDTVNETGAEYGVTLMVGGWMVTGHLTPMVRYRDWLREVGRRASISKGRHRLPGGAIGPISEHQAAKPRED